MVSTVLRVTVWR